MSFELKRQQSLRKNLRRMATGRLAKAREALHEHATHGRDEAVHSARRACKIVRALLRLVRPKIPDEIYRRENVALRDLARPLTEMRDAKVLLDTLDKLAEHFADHVAVDAFAEIRERLQANLRRVRHRILDEHHALSEATQRIDQAEKHVKRWIDVPDKWPGIGKGLKKTYRDAHLAFSAAEQEASDANLHESRKQAKYLRYQLQAIGPAWPERIDEMVDEAHRYGDLLGDDHDLAVLRDILTRDEHFEYSNETELLLALIERRRRELQAEAIQLGRRFFGETEDQFAWQLKGYWQAWRSSDALAS